MEMTCLLEDALIKEIEKSPQVRDINLEGDLNL